MTHRSDNPTSPQIIIHNSRTALFAGSFNPFTKGHLRILERALNVADRVIMAVGMNIEKAKMNDSTYQEEIYARVERIKKDVAFLNSEENPDRVKVCSYSGLTAEYARNIGADFLVRAVRNISDFEYERNLAEVNLKILGIDTIFFCAEPEYSFLSSSVVRELDANGYDTSDLLP